MIYSTEILYELTHLQGHKLEGYLWVAKIWMKINVSTSNLTKLDCQLFGEKIFVYDFHVIIRCGCEFLNTKLKTEK